MHHVHTVFLPGSVPDDPTAITTAIEEVMEHYNEQREVEPYRDEYQSFAVTRKEFTEFAASHPRPEYPAQLKLPDAEMAKKYHGQEIELDPANPGMYWTVSDYNPEGRWDWYQIGGRWPGRMQLKPDAPEPTMKLEFSWGWHQKDIDEIKAKGRPVDVARIEHVAPECIKPPGSYVDLEGKWFDDPDFWSRLNEEGLNEWQREYMQMVAALPKNTWIVNLDVHS